MKLLAFAFAFYVGLFLYLVQTDPLGKLVHSQLEAAERNVSW